MKLKKLYIQSFRGIPNECSVSFVDMKGNPCSTLIYGGNGSGKSSIIDAIEFALQGRIERSTQLNNYKRPSAINFSNINKSLCPIISIELDDCIKYKREIVKKSQDSYTEIVCNDQESLKDFSIVSLALRRNDIIAYNRARLEEKVILFSAFIIDHEGVKTTSFKDDPEWNNLHTKIVKKQKEKLTYLAQISSTTGLSCEDMQNIQDDISNYVRSKVAPMTGEKLIIKNAYRVKIPNDKYLEVIKLADTASRIQATVKKLKAQQKHLETLAKSISFDDFEDYLVPACSYLTDAFRTISNASYIEQIEIERGETATTFDFKITLQNQTIVHPHQIFSEANYDLMILLLYVSLIRVGVDRGQSKVIIFDDVLQSVDANIRTKFMDYVLDKMPDWQIIMTCHDRLWLNQLYDIFKRHRHLLKMYHIKNWSFENGPCLVEQNFFSPDTTMRQAIETENPRIIAGTAGLLLENICNHLSISLKCSIVRDANDRYTLEPLWRSVLDVVNNRKNPELNKEIKPYFENIEKLKIVRNLFGAHYNDWAESYSDEEILDFAQKVLELYDKVFCKKCCTWLTVNDDWYSCNCTNLFIQKRM